MTMAHVEMLFTVSVWASVHTRAGAALPEVALLTIPLPGASNTCPASLRSNARYAVSVVGTSAGSPPAGHITTRPSTVPTTSPRLLIATADDARPPAGIGSRE